jgi:hypothetical protein
VPDVAKNKCRVHAIGVQSLLASISEKKLIFKFKLKEFEMKTNCTFGLNAAALLTMGLLSGCANPIYEGRLAWEDGWREGVVTSVGGGSAFTEKLSSNCKNVNTSALQSTRYATITHKPVTGRVWLTVPVAEDVPLKPNDLVYVNVFDCRKRVERR